ncbi:unnamed protein product, partial [Amoebophrya sp. A120]|eukprot:GSA120T00000562001.1
MLSTGARYLFNGKKVCGRLVKVERWSFEELARECGNIYAVGNNGSTAKLEKVFDSASRRARAILQQLKEAALEEKHTYSITTSPKKTPEEDE